jgi:cytochrome c553
MSGLAALIFLSAFAAQAGAADGIGAKIQICTSCHGKDGEPSDPTVPIIWGQQQAYLEKQLRDYKSGDRNSQIMSSMAESLRNEEIPDVAADLAAKSWPLQSNGNPTRSPPDAIAACQACHQKDFLGGSTAGGLAPRLAGQARSYLVDAMGSFANGERDNNSEMSAMLRGIGATGREAIAGYLSRL